MQAAFDNLPGSIGFIRNGQFRPLGVTTTVRSDALPDTPSIADFLPGYEVSAFYGLNAPKGTPPEVIGTLNKAVNDALADPEVHDKLVKSGATPVGGTAEALGAFMKSEYEKWGKVVAERGIKDTP